MNTKAVLAILGLMFGCCANVVILEFMIKYVELFEIIFREFRS